MTIGQKIVTGIKYYLWYYLIFFLIAPMVIFMFKQIGLI